MKQEDKENLVGGINEATTGAILLGESKPSGQTFETQVGALILEETSWNSPTSGFPLGLSLKPPPFRG